MVMLGPLDVQNVCYVEKMFICIKKCFRLKCNIDDRWFISGLESRQCCKRYQAMLAHHSLHEWADSVRGWLADSGYLVIDLEIVTEKDFCTLI